MMMTKTKPEYFDAEDGTKMVRLRADVFDELLESLEDAEDSLAAIAARAQVDAEGCIPAVVSRAIRNGTNPVRAWRGYRGMTQAALAEAANIRQPAIVRIEKASSGAGRPDTLRKIAAALDAPLWSLEGLINQDDEDLPDVENAVRDILETKYLTVWDRHVNNILIGGVGDTSGIARMGVRSFVALDTPSLVVDLAQGAHLGRMRELADSSETLVSAGNIVRQVAAIGKGPVTNKLGKSRSKSKRKIRVLEGTRG